MLRRFSVDFAIFSMLVDAGLVMLALRLAALVRPQLDEIFPFTRPIASAPPIEGLLYSVFALVWVGVLTLFSVYDGRRNIRFVHEWGNLTLGSLLATIALAGLLYLTFREISRAMFLSFAALAYSMTFGARLLYHLIFALRTRDRARVRRVLIVGAGLVGKEVAQNITKYASLGLSLAGYLDDDPQKQKDPLVRGNLLQARQVILNERVDDVVLALPLRAYNKVNQLSAELHDLPVRVWVIPDYFALALHQAKMEEFAGMPLIDLRAPALDEYQRMVKRAFDIAVCLLLMPLALPLMALIALAIKLDSPGPALFRQQRVGENGRLFWMLKFRSMTPNAEQMRQVIEKVGPDGRIHQDKRSPDPRVTRVGRFLRRSSLDELPQLFNVLRGEMSLVGPRPEMPHLVDQYESWQRKRFAVPQGITGWWQVNGRSDKPMHEHTEDDLYYLQNYSLWLDIIILLKTLWVVINHKGAY